MHPVRGSGLVSGVAAQVTPKARSLHPARQRCVWKPNNSARKAIYFSPTAKSKSNTTIYRLRADHVQYNAKTYVAAARGNVQLDVDTQHLDRGFGRLQRENRRGTLRARARRSEGWNIGRMHTSWSRPIR